MPSDLTPEQREAAVDAMVQAYDAEFNHTNNAFRRPMRAALAALLLAGWRPEPQPDAISAAEARGRREGIEAAAKESPRVSGVLEGHFGEWVQFSGIDQSALILVSTIGRGGLIPRAVCLPHQLYTKKVRELESLFGTVVVCSIPVAGEHVDVSRALSSIPPQEADQ